MKFYRWRPHPWHGLEPGSKAPELVDAYLEITPFDSMKYEVDKSTYKLDTFQQSPVKLEKPYGAKKAQKVIRAAMEDYAAYFPTERP